ncbi:hypothetical protein [Alkalicoccobacillus plakortidis]|uniref:YusW-like protein n=1 Tax=Alkalicoccobacillus plakortidis TaxID=444060 RepID=A0ABT0XHU3_9BACI|nr:hypothetical protein [Alkalicoccobacillus plakortidis]MCM2675280.1 hypothetical protein [Alkalicoccobacillus plakortidis]
MKKGMVVFVALLMIGILALPSQAMAGGFELMQTFSLRITVVENGTEHEWEYDSPSHYEFETGTTVIKGKEAKIQVDQMISTLQIKKAQTREQYKEALIQMYPNLESFDIRFIDEDDRLYTWGLAEEGLMSGEEGLIMSGKLSSMSGKSSSMSGKSSSMSGKSSSMSGKLNSMSGNREP